MMTLLRLAAWLMLAFLLNSATAAAEQSRMDSIIGISQAIKVAEEAIAARPERPGNLRIVAAKLHSTPENDVTGPNPHGDNELVKRLTGATYWLVYYRSATSELGGDVGVFVDAKNGNVIYVYRGR